MNFTKVNYTHIKVVNMNENTDYKIGLAVLNIPKKRDKDPISASVLRQINDILSMSANVIFVSANNPIGDALLLAFNSRCKTNDKVVIIQYEQYLRHNQALELIDTILGSETVFPIDFDTLVLSIGMSNNADFFQVKSGSDFKIINPCGTKQYDSAIGLIRAPSSLTSHSYQNIKNSLFRATQCSTFCLVDYLVCDEMEDGFSLEVLGFQSTREHSLSNIMFINDDLEWSKVSISPVNGGLELINKINQSE
jgi:hypothetical protein